MAENLIIRESGFSVKVERNSWRTKPSVNEQNEDGQQKHSLFLLLHKQVKECLIAREKFFFFFSFSLQTYMFEYDRFLNDWPYVRTNQRYFRPRHSNKRKDKKTKNKNKNKASWKQPKAKKHKQNGTLLPNESNSGHRIVFSLFV